MSNNDWSSDLRFWESFALSSLGAYIGIDLSYYGFSWERGNPIPVSQRHSAFLEWRAAVNKLAMIEKYRNRPDLVSSTAIQCYRKSSKDPLFQTTLDFFASLVAGQA